MPYPTRTNMCEEATVMCCHTCREDTNLVQRLLPSTLIIGQQVPHNIDKVSGGSSSGFTAVVCASLCHFAWSLDGGLSVRIAY